MRGPTRPICGLVADPVGDLAAKPETDEPSILHPITILYNCRCKESNFLAY